MGLLASTSAQAQNSRTLSPQQRYTLHLPGAQVEFGGHYPITTGVGKGTSVFGYGLVFPARHEAFLYKVVVGSPNMAITRALDGQDFAGISQTLAATWHASVMHRNGNWSVVAQNSEGCMRSARGGYVGRTVIAVVGLRRPGSAAEPTCASMTATRDSIYMALAARARG